MSNHPADQERLRALHEFINTPAEQFISGENIKSIPSFIGVKCVNSGSRGRLDVERSDDKGNVFHRYASDPTTRELYVGYKRVKGSLDRSKPILFIVNQSWTVFQEKSGKRIPLDVPDNSPLKGRNLGTKGDFKRFLKDWEQALNDFFQDQQIEEHHRLVQGCVIEKTDGSQFQLRNFRKGEPWRKATSFKDIARVYRSPFHAIANDKEGNNG